MENNNLKPTVQGRTDLGELDEAWRGWLILRGELFDPLHSSTRGYTPSEIRSYPIRLSQIAALERELRDLKRDLANLLHEQHRARTRTVPANDPVTALAEPSELARRRAASPVIRGSVQSGIAPRHYEGQSRPELSRSRE